MANLRRPLFGLLRVGLCGVARQFAEFHYEPLQISAEHSCTHKFGPQFDLSFFGLRQLVCWLLEADISVSASTRKPPTRNAERFAESGPNKLNLCRTLKQQQTTVLSVVHLGRK